MTPECKTHTPLLTEQKTEHTANQWSFAEQLQERPSFPKSSQELEDRFRRFRDKIYPA